MDPISQWILAGRFQEKGFSAVAPTFWNIMSLKVRCAQNFLGFWKSLKTWLCQMVWGPSGVPHVGNCYLIRKKIPPPPWSILVFYSVSLHVVFNAIMFCSFVYYDVYKQSTETWQWDWKHLWLINKQTCRKPINLYELFITLKCIFSQRSYTNFHLDLHFITMTTILWG